MSKTKNSTEILKLQAEVYKLRSRYHQMFKTYDLDQRIQILKEIQRLEAAIKFMEGRLF